VDILTSSLDVINHIRGCSVGVGLTESLVKGEEKFEQRFQSTFQLQNKVLMYNCFFPELSHSLDKVNHSSI